MSNFIKPIEIGDLKLSNNVFLAPLAGVADSSFRAVCKEFGAGLCFSEMISAKGVHYNSKGSKELSRHLPIEEPFGVQIFGSEPDIMAEAAKVFEDMGASLIDINMGCPVPKVTGNKEGSYLLNSPLLIGKIVEKTANAVRIPLTVKMRRGYNTPNEVAPEIAHICEESGAKMVTVHGRFRDEYYSGSADLGVVKRVKERVKIPVVASGDIVSFGDAEKAFTETGCDAIMIGRGALGRPWIFREIIEGHDVSLSRPEICEIIKKQLSLAATDKGASTAIKEMRKHIAWYIKGTRNAAFVKNSVFASSTLNELEAVLKAWCDS